MLNTADSAIKGTKSLLERPVGILSTGMYLPEHVVDNAYWEERVDTTSEWIIKKTGINERRFVTEENTSDMCVHAATQALEQASLKPEEVDILIVSTFTPDYLLPSTALLIKEKIGAYNAMPIDLTQTACAGFAYGVFMGAQFLQNLHYKNILVISGDAFSKIINPDDRTSSVLVGDAAGAAVLRRLTERGVGLLSWDFGSDLSFDVGISHGGTANPIDQKSLDKNLHKFFMKGKTVWEKATKALPETLGNSLSLINKDIHDLDFLLCHQANKRLVEYVIDNLKFDWDKTHLNVDRLGNTGGATLPTVLHEAIENKKIKEGDLIGLTGIGVGFLWGSIVFQHTMDRSLFEKE